MTTAQLTSRCSGGMSLQGNSVPSVVVLVVSSRTKRLTSHFAPVNKAYAEYSGNEEFGSKRCYYCYSTFPCPGDAHLILFLLLVASYVFSCNLTKKNTKVSKDPMIKRSSHDPLQRLRVKAPHVEYSFVRRRHHFPSSNFMTLALPNTVKALQSEATSLLPHVIDHR